MDLGAALTTNIDGTAIVAGALIGAATVAMAPVAVAMAGEALMGAGLLAGSTGLFSAGMSVGGVATTMGAAIYGLSAVKEEAAASTSKAIVPYDPKFALQQGANPKTVVPDSYTVVRGGQSPMPSTGTTFSGSMGSTGAEAASGVPHGSIRVTTAGQIRASGGIVELKPELTRSGVLNWRHVNVIEGSTKTVFSNVVSNPVSKQLRMQ